MEPHGIAAKGMNNEGGYVLVGALLVLLLLVVIGIAATTSTIMEIQIAGSDRTHKENFYAADGGTQIGSELVEQSIWDFPSITLPVNANGVSYLGAGPVGTFFISGGPANYQQLFMNPDVDTDGTQTPGDVTDDALLANRDAYFNYGVPDPTGATVPRTDIQIGGQAVQNPGGSLQQLAGYEGKGKGAAGGGGGRLYGIHSISFGNDNSESWLIIDWLHVL